MSPEQARGESLDGRTDVFSLGSVLYLALTGALPFKGNDDGQVLERVAKGDFVPASKRMPSLPKELGHLLAAAMRPEAWSRYQTAHELLAAIEVVLRAGARSELERWLAVLHEADHDVPPTREKSSVVPLKVVRTAPTKPAVVPRRVPKRRLAAAAAALVVLGFGAQRAWLWWSELAPNPSPLAVAMEPPAPSYRPWEPPLTPAPLVQASVASLSEPAQKPPPPEPEIGVGDVKVIDEQDEHVPIAVLSVSGRVMGISDQDRAMVLIDSEPGGADVLLDGRVYGTTPLTLRFRTGIPFELVFMREGHAPLTRWLTVERPKVGPPRVTFSDPIPRI
jgi:hypothetical protein